MGENALRPTALVEIVVNECDAQKPRSLKGDDGRLGRRPNAMDSRYVNPL
jgi:hypothetical protein